MKVAIPAGISRPVSEIEDLMFRFGNARRRAYSMKQKDIDRLEILKQLHRETDLPTRYVYTAYDSIKALPPHVTFGGLKLQRLREQGKISKEEFHRRRNSILACRGDRSVRGNLCLRIEGDKLRINLGPNRWVWVPICVPEKYRSCLDESKPHTVIIKRRMDGRGYDVRIIIDAEEPVIEEPNRVMALDINSGHVDFAVVEKQKLKPIVFGKFNCSEMVNARCGKKKILTHKLVNKVTNIARHYGAEVVAGKLKTLYCKSHRKANRKVQGMNQFAMRQIMSYKLPLKGVKYRERSEGRTSQVGSKLSKPFGLDVHKASAYAFAVKVIDNPSFTFLRGVRADEGDGIPSVGLSGGSGLTALHQIQMNLVHDELRTNVRDEATPNLGKGGRLEFEPFQTHILQVKV